MLCLLKEGFVRCCCCLLLFCLLYFICSFNCILLRLSVDVFLLLFAKIDKFYTLLVTLTSSVFVLVLFFLSVGLSVFVVVVGLFMLLSNLSFGCCLRGV